MHVLFFFEAFFRIYRYSSHTKKSNSSKQTKLRNPCAGGGDWFEHLINVLTVKVVNE